MPCTISAKDDEDADNPQQASSLRSYKNFELPYYAGVKESENDKCCG